MPIVSSSSCDCAMQCQRDLDCQGWTFSIGTFTQGARNCWLRYEWLERRSNCNGDCFSAPVVRRVPLQTALPKPTWLELDTQPPLNETVVATPSQHSKTTFGQFEYVYIGNGACLNSQNDVVPFCRSADVSPYECETYCNAAGDACSGFQVNQNGTDLVYCDLLVARTDAPEGFSTCFNEKNAAYAGELTGRHLPSQIPSRVDNDVSARCYIRDDMDCSLWACTCQGLSDCFGVKHDVTFGKTSVVMQEWWVLRKCTTVPSSNPCPASFVGNSSYEYVGNGMCVIAGGSEARHCQKAAIGSFVECETHCSMADECDGFSTYVLDMVHYCLLVVAAKNSPVGYDTCFHQQSLGGVAGANGDMAGHCYRKERRDAPGAINVLANASLDGIRPTNDTNTRGVTASRDEDVATFGCRITPDPVDWRRLFQAHYGWATRRSHSYLQSNTVKLMNFFTESPRTLETEPCFLGILTTRFVALDMAHDHGGSFVTMVHDMFLMHGYRFLQRLDWLDVARSDYGRTLFAILARFSEGARLNCPHLAGPPRRGDHALGYVWCLTNGRADVAQTVRIGLRSAGSSAPVPTVELGGIAPGGEVGVSREGDVGDDGWSGSGRLSGENGQVLPFLIEGPSQGEDGWCVAIEPTSAAVRNLWVATRRSLEKGIPDVALVQAATHYLAQMEGCVEAEAVSALALVWTGKISQSKGISVAQNALHLLSLPRVIFTRWPVWDLMAIVANPLPAPVRMDELTCVNYQPCRRSAAFYARQLDEALLAACPQVADGVVTQFSNGVIHAKFAAGVPQELQIRVVDTTEVKQRMEYAAIDKMDEYRLKVTKVSYFPGYTFPVTVGDEFDFVEGVLILTDRHRSNEVHIEPRPRQSVADRAFANTLRLGRGRRPSIYMLVLESASQTAFEALCPRTVAFLRSAARSSWQSFDFPMFHASRGSTPENMFPATSGMPFDRRYEDLRRRTWSCDPMAGDVPPERLLWNIMKANGYVTAYGSSGCNGLVGTRYCKQWLDQFDHVPPSLDVDPNCPSQHEVRLPQRPGSGCKGSRRYHEHLLDYFLKLFRVYSSNSVFAYLHLEAAHENIAMLQILDIALEAHIRQLSNLPVEARPIILLAGDHGPPNQCDWISPLVSLMVPQPLFAARLWQTWARGLRSNRFSITSWFDMYATLGDIAVGQRLPERQAFLPNQRIQTLLYSHLKNRTCADAGIDEWHCGCSQQWQPWCPIGKPALKVVLKSVLTQVSGQTTSYLAAYKQDPSRCPELTLKDITSCQGQADSLGRVEEALQHVGAKARVVLRVGFSVEHDMAYEIFMYIHMTSATGNHKDVLAEVGEVLSLWPTSRYQHNEDCSPLGSDPAFCTCGTPVKEAQTEMQIHANTPEMSATGAW
eukprot:TRINITY_DN23962_c0_g1_i1.p1 TRINITY_DN23962_c0_g1~~TRINITY_DN23962_c0_g1_i1.p1  ORF type:complete len:1451 (-),score=217.47 TRINITY_DN23962_c0_g1_i1:74-4219(-)